MRRKQILIGLFAFIIYRTIGEPKNPQGGRERAFVDTCFLRPATAGTGILGVVFARPVTAGTGANGLRNQSDCGPRILEKTAGYWNTIRNGVTQTSLFRVKQRKYEKSARRLLL